MKDGVQRLGRTQKKISMQIKGYTIDTVNWVLQ